MSVYFSISASLCQIQMSPESNLTFDPEIMWSAHTHVAPGHLVIVWLVRRPFLFRHLSLIPSPDPRLGSVPRRHSRQLVQQQIWRLSPLGPRWHPLWLKGRLPHRQGFRPHPPSHPRTLDPCITSQNTDPLSRRHCVYHLVALHPTRQCRG
jgi:hypothetical protein